MSKESETICATLDLINSQRETPVRKCPFDEICEGGECRLNGQLPPPDLVEDKQQESAFRAWILALTRRN